MNNTQTVGQDRIEELLSECQVALEHGETDIGVDCVVDFQSLLKEVLELREEVRADNETIKDLRKSRDYHKEMAFVSRYGASAKSVMLDEGVS